MKQTSLQPVHGFFPEIKGKLSFGLMRLPMVGDKVDLAQTEQMVDAYMAAGFHSFDTAHGYISGQSKAAAKHALTRRHPMEIRIPDVLRLLNQRTMFPSPGQAAFYACELTKESGKASSCIACGQCTDVCPQHLGIPALLQEAAKAFE